MPHGFPSRVLCPVDFSHLSIAALGYAAQFASACGAEITALHAQHFEVPPYFTHAGADELRKQYENTMDAARRALARAAEQAGIESARIRIEEGDPAQTIGRIVRDVKADLIVMGTHGRRGLERFMLGSVAERVLRTSSVPVLTVRAPAAAPGISRILCPVNDSEAARAAFQAAAQLAACFGAQLTAVHIEERADAARIDDLCAWVASGDQPKCDVQHLRGAGNPAGEILKMAAASATDLLVIGAAHRAFFDSTVLGSTTIRVVRHATCPVLTVMAAASRERIVAA